ncbi:MAG: GNAT family N-acetyltransferase, partial [Anaerolineales bacterium]|nr:GNAT family N-acetyltransferase [Anaerolineales bacterium]
TLLTETIPAQSRAEGRESFIVCAAPEHEPLFSALFSGKQLIRRQRQYFELDARQFSSEPILPDGYHLLPVDADLLAQTHLQNMDWLKEEMVSERPSLDDFLAKSFGVCAIHADKIVGWCLSEYNCGPRCEIGIATDEAHQRKGLATAMATAVIQHALSQGIHQIGWLCWADNTPSSATARKLGFQLIAEMPAFPTFFDDVIHFGVQGNLCFSAGDFEQAVDWYERAVAAGAAPVWVQWNAACANGRLGRETAVIHHLQEAIAAGFDDWERLHNSPHLAAIRETAVWQIFIKQMGHG